MRYLRLYFTYAKMSIMSKLVYKANVFIGVGAFLFGQVASLATLFILVGSVPSLEGYTMWQVGFLFGVVNMAVGIDHLFTDRLWTIAYFEVRQGKLDHMLLRPAPVLFQVIASEVQLEALGEIIIAVAMLVLCGINLGTPVTLGGVLVLALGILCAALIISAFKVIFASFAFKFTRSGPMLQFVYNFSGYVKYPMKIYPKAVQAILTFVIPLGLCLSLPFENLLAPTYNPWLLGGTMLLSTAAFAALSVLIWTKMLRLYESTGT